jgi:hypothetical protein
MAKKQAVWIRADHADEYLVAAAHYLARAATGPTVSLLPPPSVSATLYCAFAAEAYVNVALIRLLGEDEYEPIARMPVRSKYFLAPRLGSREVWFTEGEAVLESLDQLFTTRNRLVHAQPERLYWASTGESDPPPDVEAPRPELTDVARWLSATADAVCRLAQSHAELSEMQRIAGPLVEIEPLLRRFDPERDGPTLERSVRNLRERLIRQDEEGFLLPEEIDDLVNEQDPDWDLRGLDSE